MSRTPVAAAVIVVLGALAGPASASALTKGEYIAQADQICRPAKLAFKRDFLHAKKEFKRRRGRARILVAARFYGANGARMQKVTARLRVLSPPAENANALGTWLDGRESAADLYLAARRAAQHGKAARFIFTLIAASQTQTEAEKYVAGYGFRYCSPPALPPQL